MFDLVSLGELLIDFTPVRVGEKFLFEKNPGGAPANVATGVAKLGGKSAFIGKVGNDNFGRFLESVLKENGVETSGILFSETAYTTLAFVELDEKNERSFTFYRKYGADTLLKASEVRYELIKQSKVFHFGSLSMCVNPSFNATIKALKFAKKCGCIISFDPNLRTSLWNNLSIAKKRIISVLKYVDILKLSEEEFYFLTGLMDNIENNLRVFSEKNDNIKVILLTLGEKGCYYCWNREIGNVPGFKVEVLDTTGAGDAFLSGFLFRALRKGLFEKNLSKEEIDEIVRFANATAAITVSRRGAIPALPYYDEVETFLKKSG